VNGTVERWSSTALPPDNEMWEVAHVARFLKRSESWVYKKSSSGVLPVHRLDGWGLRYVPAEIRAWAQRQTRARAAAR
jgi:predicted DNA-binding transcriptional regulator AlpA